MAVIFPGLKISDSCSTLQTKELDANLPSEFDEILKKDHSSSETVKNLVQANAVMVSDSVRKDHQKSSYISAERKQAQVVVAS